MGVVDAIAHDQFPKQSEWVGHEVQVCFHYDTEHVIKGRILRDDLETPGEIIIQLEDGRVVRGVECQYRPPKGPPKPAEDPTFEELGAHHDGATWARVMRREMDRRN